MSKLIALIFILENIGYQISRKVCIAFDIYIL